MIYSATAPIPALHPGALPVDPFDLALAQTMVNQFLHQSKNIPMVGAYGLPTEEQLEDAYHQVVAKLREVYRDMSPEMLMSLCWRLFSMHKLARSGVLNEWLSSGSRAERESFPAVVIYAAATLPLQARGGFDPHRFIECIRE